MTEPVKTDRTQKILTWTIAALAIVALGFMIAGCAAWPLSPTETAAVVQAAAEGGPAAAAQTAGEIAEIVVGSVPTSTWLGFIPAAYAPWAALLLLGFRRYRETAGGVISGLAGAVSSAITLDHAGSRDGLVGAVKSLLALPGAVDRRPAPPAAKPAPRR